MKDAQQSEYDTKTPSWSSGVVTRFLLPVDTQVSEGWKTGISDLSNFSNLCAWLIFAIVLYHENLM